MNERQAAILAAIIGEYIRTGEPVGSSWLVAEGDFEVSPATIRNEMGELDEAGFLEQPHTSAGRVPTEEAFRYYLEHFLEAESPSARAIRKMQSLLRQRRMTAEVLRDLARGIAAIADEAALVGWEDGDVYVSGLGQLLRQREFEDADLRFAVASAFDASDELLARFAHFVTDEIVVVIGERNPLGEEYGSVITRLPVGQQQPLLGIVGPLRMDYRAHVGLLQQLHRILGSREVEVKVR